MFKELQTAVSFLQEKSKKELLSGQAGEILKEAGKSLRSIVRTNYEK